MSGVAQKPMCDLRPGDVFKSSNGRTYRVVEEPEESLTYYCDNSEEDRYGPEIRVLVSIAVWEKVDPAAIPRYYFAPANEIVQLIDCRQLHR